MTVFTASAVMEKQDEDDCSLSLVRRLAALLDIPPDQFVHDSKLPRGWQVCLFGSTTRQSQLSSDGGGGIGILLPHLAGTIPLIGGRHSTFHKDIPVGARLRRLSKVYSCEAKDGKGGKFHFCKTGQDIFLADTGELAIEERQDIFLKPAASVISAQGNRSQLCLSSEAAPNAPAMTITPDEVMLFRYSAVTFSSYRIHYDVGYTLATAGMKALLVPAGLPALFLLKLLTTHNAGLPRTIAVRFFRPMYCGRPMYFHLEYVGSCWRLWVNDEENRLALEMKVEMAHAL